MICVPLLGNDPARRDRPIRTGRRDKPIIQLPSIALRVAVILGIAAVMFGIVFFRLWFLQILKWRGVRRPGQRQSPQLGQGGGARGNIVDRNGEVLVENRPGTAVGIRLMAVPEGGLDAEIERLAQVLKMRPGKIRNEIMDYLRPSTMEQNEDGSWTQLPHLEEGAGRRDHRTRPDRREEDVNEKTRSYLKEHTLDFPGVEVRDQYLRSYPQGDMAAQLAGPPRRPLRGQPQDAHYKGYKSGDVVGQDGLEYTYDEWLRGRDGVARIEVDAFGRPKQTDPVGGRMADPGDTLVTTLDAKVQAAAESALRTGISLAHSQDQYAANGGAAVVLDVETGEIIGMASYPTYDPSVWVGGISTKDYKKLTKKSANNPMINRPISETKAVGSTFKAVTAVAALEEGVITSGTDLLLSRGVLLDVRQRRPAAGVQVLVGRRPRVARPDRRAPGFL